MLVKQVLRKKHLEKFLTPREIVEKIPGQSEGFHARRFSNAGVVVVGKSSGIFYHMNILGMCWKGLNVAQFP
jgi:hypothetical protein